MKTENMKRILLVLVGMLGFGMAHGQVQHLYEHIYPVVQQEDERIRLLMDQVSKDSIYATIDHLQNYHTRRWDSQMVYEVQDWLYETYRGLGIDSVYLHDFIFSHHDTLYETSDNVIAIQRGVLYPDEYVVCGAHYDSYNLDSGHPDSLRAPGADDNASGVAGVLETARLLSPCKFERSIIYCNFAAEEIGLKGSAAYARDCAARMMDIVGYFNLDMIGYLQEGSDIHVHLMYVSRDSLLANYVYDLGEVYYPEMPIRRAWLTWGDSDYSSFNRNGYAAIHAFEDVHASSPFIHTPNDLLGLSVNNMDQAQRFTALNLGLVATLAGMVSNGVEESDPEDLTVFPNPVSGTLTVKGVPMKTVEIYDLLGQRVYNETCHGEEMCVNVSSLAAGVYVLRVIDDALQVHTHRIITY